MNYQDGLVELGRRLVARGGGVLNVEIQHDDHCAALAGGACHCEPIIVPIVSARREWTADGGRFVIVCPYCGRKHRHAPEPGYRVPHCGRSERCGDGYILRESPTA